MKNLEKFDVTEITPNEILKIEGGNFWDKLVEVVEFAAWWVDYNIRDFQDDHRFNDSVSTFR